MRLALALFGTLLTTMTAVCAPAQATVPGDNGQIAFTRTIGASNDEIYVVTPGGSGGETNLTNDPDDDFEAAWSPDGQKIAFISDRDLAPLDQYPDLWIMDADGTDQTRLTPEASGVSWIEWFPDGSRILFRASRCTGDPALCGTYSVSPEGGDITPAPECCPGDNVTWSPYGEPLAYSMESSTGVPSIHTVNPDGSGHGILHPSRGPVSSLDWSPDGAGIVYDDFVTGGAGSLKVVEWPNGALRRVPGSAEFDRSPTWSPDGTKLAFIGDTGQVTTMGVDGSDRHVVASTGSDADPDWQTLNPQPVPQGYARPKAAHEMSTFLVPAYAQCTPQIANRTHAPPLAHPSCSPPSMLSQNLTMGTADSNGLPTRFLGSVKFLTLRGDPGTPGDQADVSVSTSMIDVRCRFEVVDDPDTQTYPCRAGALADYTGDVQLKTTLRITDKPSTGPRTGTMQDVAIRVNVPCTSTPDSDAGGTCALSTTMDTLIPGAVVEGRRSLWTLGRIEVLDAGIDGDAETLWNNELFAVQGVFVP